MRAKPLAVVAPTATDSAGGLGASVDRHRHHAAMNAQNDDPTTHPGLGALTAPPGIFYSGWLDR